MLDAGILSSALRSLLSLLVSSPVFAAAPSPIQCAEAHWQSLKIHILTRIKRKIVKFFILVLSFLPFCVFLCFAKFVSFVISAVSQNCEARPSFSRNIKTVT
jgi:hypothetical protein